MKRLENIKRTLDILLASLTAIALFACSNDNSISSAEDVDYSPVKALQKAPVDNDITPYATGSVTAFFQMTSSNTTIINIPPVPNPSQITNTEIY